MLIMHLYSNDFFLVYGNKQEEFVKLELVIDYYQMEKYQRWFLQKKKLQIVSRNESHVSIVMLCSNSAIDVSGNVFRIVWS
jgi:hypothetical protein